jgi:hypothetical protein
MFFSWKFAYEAIVNEEVRPRFDCYKWENIKAHLDRVKEYRAIHFQELTGKLTAEQKKRAEVEIRYKRKSKNSFSWGIGIGKKTRCF